MRPRQAADMRGLDAVGVLLQLHVFSSGCVAGLHPAVVEIVAAMLRIRARGQYGHAPKLPYMLW